MVTIYKDTLYEKASSVCGKVGQFEVFEET